MVNALNVKKSLEHDNDNRCEPDLKPKSNASSNNAGSNAVAPSNQVKKSRSHPGRNPLPNHLERQTITHDLKPSDKTCGECGGFLSLMGSETREQLEAIIQKYIIKVHSRLKYACKCCQACVKLAPAPPEAMEKGIAGPILLAQVLVDKYADHLPLYRQEQRFARSDIDLSRGTLWNWIRHASNSLQPLVEAMKADLLVLHHVFSDDTTMPTLRERKPENLGKQTKTNYMWVYAGVSKTADAWKNQKPIILYDYTAGRDAKFVSDFLKDFTGYVQSDAYSGYGPLSNSGKVVSIGCWAHVRRKFYEAVSNPDSMANEMMEKIGKLYDLEREFKTKSLSIDEIKERRKLHSRPILEDIQKWLETYHPSTVPKSSLGKAIGYAVNNWHTLTKYIEDGRLEIDNNRSERCIKPVVIGRKNYMFMGSEKGGHAASITYSLIETCKQNGVDPLAYLADVLQRIPTHLNKNIKELLPYNWVNSSTTQTHAAQAPPQKIA